MTKQPIADPMPDQALSVPAPWADAVLHVYNDDYLGIRASASALPGRKMVLPNQQWHYQEHLQTALALAKASTATHIVFHGMSNAIFETAAGIHRTNPSLRLFGVWHGGPSQWVDAREAAELTRFLRLDKEVFVRSHIMKPGCNAVLAKPSAVTLVNCPPRHLTEPRPSRSRTALVPGTPSTHKNIWGNLLAAELAHEIDEVRHYANLPHAPMSLTKGAHVQYPGPEAHQEMLSAVRVVLNASTMDCHPMVDLEAAAAGRPSLHMNLHLGVLTDHPLEQLATVADSASIQSISEALHRCLEVPSLEMFELCLDYAAQMRLISLQRWHDFLFEGVA